MFLCVLNFFIWLGFSYFWRLEQIGGLSEMDDEHPEWLPADWKVCVRVRTSGKKDKYYINPSNGLKYNSKPEVLRYLKTSKKDVNPKEPNKTIFKQTVAEKLPSGWIKEIKITRKGGKTRRDPYYIDPVSGRHFRSMQEVNRYLETKDSGKAESNEDDPDLTNEELEHSKSSTVVAEEQRSVDRKEDKILTGNESIKSEGAAVEIINPLETKNAIGQREKEKDSVGEDGQQEKVTPAPQNKRKKLKSKWMNELPRRSSKRLARVEADPPLDIKTINEARESAGLLDEAQVNTIKNINKSEIDPPLDIKTINEAREAAGPLDEAEVNSIENINKSEINTSEESGKQKEPTNPPLRDVSFVEEHEAVGSGTDLKEDEKTEKPLDSSLNDLLMDPCIEFAIKTLTGAIPIEDVNKVDSSVASRASPNRTLGSSSSLSFNNIWADPCFEFAVKTLTSEIPTEGGSRFQISFEPLGSSGAGGCNSMAK